MSSLLVTPSSFASSISFTFAATAPSPPRKHSHRLPRTAGPRSQARLALRLRLPPRPPELPRAAPPPPAPPPRHQRAPTPRQARDHERFDDLRAHPGELRERGAVRRRQALARRPLGLDLRLALDVDAHARQLRREPRVLALLADREGELVVGDDDERRRQAVGFARLRDHDGRHLRRRQRARDERRRVVRPLDDVDLLAPQLAADDLDARAAQSDAGADRIDVPLGRGDGDLGALARLASRGLHEDDPLLDLGDLRLEQPGEVARVGPRERDLRALRRAPNLEDVGADPVARVVALARDLLPLREDRLGLADLEDHVTLLDPMDDAPEDLPLLARELRVDSLALRVPDLLQDHLLGGLGRDPPELLRWSLLLELELVAELGLFVQRLGFGQADLDPVVGHLLDDLLAPVDPEVAALPVDVHAHVVGRAEGLPRGREQGGLQRLEEDLLVDPLLATDLFDDGDQLPVHRLRRLPEILRPARPADFRLQTDLREASTRKLHALAIVLDHEPVGLDSHELAAHLAPAGEPAAELPPDRPAELALLPEQAVQPGGGYFEIVGRVERRGRVGPVAPLAAHPLTVPDPDAARLVDEEAQDPARPARAPLDINQLEPVVAQNWHHDLLDLVARHRIVHRGFPPARGQN